MPCSSRIGGQQPDQPVRGDLEPGGVEDLASRCASAARPAPAGRRASAPARPPRPPSPPASEKPNFWSSCAVAMNSWVCASTPTRHAHHDRAPDAAARRRSRPAARSPRASPRTIRPTPASTRALQLGDGLVVAVEGDPLGRESGAQRDGQFAAGADVQAETLLGGPRAIATDRKDLAGVEHVGVRAERLDATSRARRRESSSSSRYAGVPNSLASSRTSTPAEGERAGLRVARHRRRARLSGPAR